MSGRFSIIGEACTCPGCPKVDAYGPELRHSPSILLKCLLCSWHAFLDLFIFLPIMATRRLLKSFHFPEVFRIGEGRILLVFTASGAVCKYVNRIEWLKFNTLCWSPHILNTRSFSLFPNLNLALPQKYISEFMRNLSSTSAPLRSTDRVDIFVLHVRTYYAQCWAFCCQWFLHLEWPPSPTAG